MARNDFRLRGKRVMERVKSRVRIHPSLFFPSFFSLFSGLIAVVVSLFVSRDLKHRDARYDDAVPDVKF